MDNELALRDDVFEPTATGLVVHGSPTFDEWELYGKKLQFVEGAIQFLIGDWLNVGEQKWGEMYSQAIDEEQAATWAHYKWVANKVELCIRIHNLSWSHHQMVAPLEPEEQRAWLISAKENGWGANELRRQIHLSTKVLPPSLNGKYRIVYADPPWQYGNTMPEYYGVQDDHYPTMTLDEIISLPICNLADDNSVLFLWSTSPILPEALEVIKAWGFEYKSSFVWDKVKHVMGHYNSVRHELLLLATRGSCQPDERKLFDSVYSEERTEHSVKPEYFRNVIDTIYPHGKRIELFARVKVDGWDAYGNEVI